MHEFHTTLENLLADDSKRIDLSVYYFGETRMPGFRVGPPIMFFTGGFNNF
jgi:hypothetical protein